MHCGGQIGGGSSQVREKIQEAEVIIWVKEDAAWTKAVSAVGMCLKLKFKKTNDELHV